MNLEKLTKMFWGPKSNFKIGDSVRPANGDQLMVVVEIISEPKMEQPLIHCQWYDCENKDTRRNLFPENNLKLFDWYQSNGKTWKEKTES